MSAVQVSGIFTYPIKSCGGLSHQNIKLTPNGFEHDRQWLLVRDNPDERGMFITQREFPRMALIHPRFVDDILMISAPDSGEVCVPLEQQRAASLVVTVWKDTVRAVDEGDQIAAWFSEFLGASVRLVRFDDETVRPISMKFTDQPGQTGFADGYPILIATEESLADLNTRLLERGKSTVPMRRFRPNIVFKGTDEAFDEDHWKWITINGVFYEVAKPCARCAITTVDPATGIIPEKGEPLATLETFRRVRGVINGVLFGQNVIHRGLGEVRLGDSVTIDQRAEPIVLD